MSSEPPVPRGAVRLRGVSRRFRLVTERSATLKETLVRRRRTRATDLWAVRELDLDIAPGEAVGFIGQNGAGKSTLLKLVAGIIPPQEGTVEVGGAVASMLELGAGFHPDFTGRENVYLNASIHGLSTRDVDERIDDVIAFSELAPFIDMPVRTYSSGMYMRLAFAIASHVSPDVLLLDEVLAVGDEAFQRRCYGRIFDYRRGGGTLLFVSHDPNAVERVCDRAVLLVDGRVAADGPPADVLAVYHKRLVGRPASDPGAMPALSAAPPRAAGAPPPGDDERSWGTGDVVIRDCRLVGLTGATDRFMSGDPLAVEIDVAPDGGRHVETPTFGIAVHTVDGTLVYGTNTRLDSLPVPNLDGPATVRFTVPALPLHEGRFTVTVAVHSHDDSVIYHWLDRWLEFSVFQRVGGVGPVDLSGEWGITASAGAGDPAAAGGAGSP